MTAPPLTAELPRGTTRDPGARAFAWALLIALGFRALLMAVLWLTGGDPLEPDSPLYLRLASALAEQGRFSSSLETFQPEVFRTPGYPAFLAALRLLGMDGTGVVLLVQEVLYLATVGVFYVAVKALLDLGLARAVTLFLLIEPGGIAYPKLILSDTVNLALVVAGIFALGFALRSRRWSWLLVSGLLLGAAAWVRPQAILLPLAFAPVLILAWPRPRDGLLRAGALLLVALLALSPWLARNQALFGTPYLSGQGSNMLANYHLPYVWEVTRGLPFNQGYERVAHLVDAAVEAEEKARGRPLNAVERLDVQQRLALAALMEQPAAYVQRWMIGMLKTLLGPGVLDAYAAYGHQAERVRFSEIPEASFARKLQVFLAGQDWLVLAEVMARGLILVLSLVGVIAIVRSGDPFLWIIMLFTAVTVFIPGPMGLTRLRFAAEGFLFLQAWLGLRMIRGLWTAPTLTPEARG